MTGHLNERQIVKTTRHSVAILAGIVLLAGGMLTAQGTEPLIGTWKLNAAKSKGSTIKSGTTKIEKDGDGTKWTVEMVPAEGPAYKWSFSGKFDGKDIPAAGNSPYGDAVAIERVDAHTYHLTSKRGGKVSAHQTIAIAADGKSRTTTTKGTDAKGQPIDSVAVYEKQ
jgi:Rieske Fe-S protein